MVLVVIAFITIAAVVPEESCEDRESDRADRDRDLNGRLERGGELGAHGSGSYVLRQPRRSPDECVTVAESRLDLGQVLADDRPVFRRFVLSCEVDLP